MIKKVRLQNFFSFEDEEFELHPEANVFVGINGSGKSNVLKAFRLLQEGLFGTGLKKLIYDRWGGYDAIRFKGTRNEQPITLTFVVDHKAIREPGFKFKEDIHYVLSILRVKNTQNFYLQEKLFLKRNSDQEDWNYLNFSAGSGQMFEAEEPNARPKWVKYTDLDEQELALAKINEPDRYPQLSIIRKTLAKLTVYDYLDTTLESKIRRPVIATSEKSLAMDGSNLPQMLNTIKINDKDNYRQIVDHLKNINSNFTGIDFNVIGGNIELMLEEAKYKSAVHVTHISDGTLRFLCLMAIFFNENRGGCICIDEPELGLHPDMIKSLRDAMAMSYKKTQYLITTHSDHLLDLFDLENIRVVEKDENNASHIRSLDPKAFEGWYETFSPGRMWRLGDFGGNRF